MNANHQNIPSHSLIAVGIGEEEWSWRGGVGREAGEEGGGAEGGLNMNLDRAMRDQQQGWHKPCMIMAGES